MNKHMNTVTIGTTALASTRPSVTQPVGYSTHKKEARSLVISPASGASKDEHIHYGFIDVQKPDIPDAMERIKQQRLRKKEEEKARRNRNAGFMEQSRQNVRDKYGLQGEFVEATGK